MNYNNKKIDVYSKWDKNECDKKLKMFKRNLIQKFEKS